MPTDGKHKQNNIESIWKIQTQTTLRRFVVDYQLPSSAKLWHFWSLDQNVPKRWQNFKNEAENHQKNNHFNMLQQTHKSRLKTMQPLLNKRYENLKLATILCDPFSLWAIRKKKLCYCDFLYQTIPHDFIQIFINNLNWVAF